MVHYAKLWKQAAKRWYSERRHESFIWLRPEGEVLEKLRSKAVEEALEWIHSYQDANESLMNENESLKSELASRGAPKCCGSCRHWLRFRENGFGCNFRGNVVDCNSEWYENVKKSDNHPEHVCDNWKARTP
jgi:hypothetical protein